MERGQAGCHKTKLWQKDVGQTRAGCDLAVRIQAWGFSTAWGWCGEPPRTPRWSTLWSLSLTCRFLCSQDRCEHVYGALPCHVLCRALTQVYHHIQLAWSSQCWLRNAFTSTPGICSLDLNYGFGVFKKTLCA